MYKNWLKCIQNIEKFKYDGMVTLDYHDTGNVHASSMKCSRRNFYAIQLENVV